MTATSFSIATTVPLTTAPSCGLPCAKDSSSIFAKSSRDGAAGLTAVAMNTPQVDDCPDGIDGVFPAGAEDHLRQPPRCVGSPACDVRADEPGIQAMND